MSGEAGEFIKVGEYASKLVIEKSNGDIDANFTIDSEQAKLIIKKRVVKFTKKSDAITEKSFDPENYNLFVAEDIYETTDTAFPYIIKFPDDIFNEPKDYKAHNLLSIVAVGLNNEYKEYIFERGSYGLRHRCHCTGCNRSAHEERHHKTLC